MVGAKVPNVIEVSQPGFENITRSEAIQGSDTVPVSGLHAAIKVRQRSKIPKLNSDPDWRNIAWVFGFEVLCEILLGLPELAVQTRLPFVQFGLAGFVRVFEHKTNGHWRDTHGPSYRLFGGLWCLRCLALDLRDMGK